MNSYFEKALRILMTPTPFFAFFCDPIFFEGCRMRANPWLKRIAKIGWFLVMGASMSAGAGLFGFGGTSWKEEVMLHDGSKIIVERSQSYGGRHEPGKSAPVREHTITFTLPGSGRTLSWTSEYGEDLGRANFNLLALHILNGTPYLVTEPNLCLSYNKWGRPNPPYVVFRHDGNAWQRIPLAELPAEFKAINLIVNNRREEDVERLSSKAGLVPAESVRDINSSLTQPEYKTILREAVPKAGGVCIKTDYYKGAGWLSPDWFTDQPSLNACLKFCDNKKISPEICPCNEMFKGK